MLQWRLATFSHAGQRFMCINSDETHEFGLAPTTSLFVIGANGAGARFGWVTDRFGCPGNVCCPDCGSLEATRHVQEHQDALQFRPARHRR